MIIIDIKDGVKTIVIIRGESDPSKIPPHILEMIRRVGDNVKKYPQVGLTLQQKSGIEKRELEILEDNHNVIKRRIRDILLEDTYVEERISLFFGMIKIIRKIRHF